MVSYVVTGASRGLGYEFIRQLSKDASNIVVGLVRNKAATDERLAKDGISNVTVYQADVTDFSALREAATATAKLTGGSLDYLINNAALISRRSDLYDLSYFEDKQELLNQELLDSFQINTIGVVNSVTAFIPLIKQGKMKKVITLSTALADIGVINEHTLGQSAPYTMSKAAVNNLVASYNVAYRSKGILFMAISPGVIDTTEGNPRSPEELKLLMPLFEKFSKYEPSWKGPITAQESIESVMKIASRATPEGNGGSFVSHREDGRWI